MILDVFPVHGVGGHTRHAVDAVFASNALGVFSGQEDIVISSQLGAGNWRCVDDCLYRRSDLVDPEINRCSGVIVSTKIKSKKAAQIWFPITSVVTTFNLIELVRAACKCGAHQQINQSLEVIAHSRGPIRVQASGRHARQGIDLNRVICRRCHDKVGWDRSRKPNAM